MCMATSVFSQAAQHAWLSNCQIVFFFVIPPVYCKSAETFWFVLYNVRARHFKEITFLKSVVSELVQEG